jgi:DNA-directed RNA polymerase specialized sigma24 family protein
LSGKKYSDKFNQLITAVYEDAQGLCRIKYNGSKVIYGVQFEDLFQQAVEQLLKQVSSLCKKEDHEIKPRLTEAYVKNSLVQNFDNQVGMACRKREPRVRPTNLNWIKEQYYPEESSGHEFESVEVRNLYSKLTGKARAFVRMLERDGLSIREIRRKLGIKSMRQFYRAQSNIQKLLERHGYTQEDAASSDEDEGYRTYR